MNLYAPIVFLHVCAAAILVAASLVAPLVRLAARSARDLQSLAGALSIGHRLERIAPLAALATLASGIYLGTQGWLHAAWFWGAASLFVLNVVLVTAIVGPSMSRLGAAVARTARGPIPDEVDVLRWARLPAVAANLMVAGDVAILFLMTNKPGLLDTITASALALGGAIVLGVLPARRAAGEASAPPSVAVSDDRSERVTLPA